MQQKHLYVFLTAVSQTKPKSKCKSDSLNVEQKSIKIGKRKMQMKENN